MTGIGFRFIEELNTQLITALIQKSPGGKAVVTMSQLVNADDLVLTTSFNHNNQEFVFEVKKKEEDLR